MLETYQSRFPPSPDLDKVALSFEKLNNLKYVLKRPLWQWVKVATFLFKINGHRNMQKIFEMVEEKKI